MYFVPMEGVAEFVCEDAAVFPRVEPFLNQDQPSVVEVHAVPFGVKITGFGDPYPEEFCNFFEVQPSS